MSDLPPLPPEIAKAIEEANKVQEIVILYNPANGQMQFKGPSNRVLAYGMMMMGIEVLMSQSQLFNRSGGLVT